MISFQQIIFTLQQYWADVGCIILQPFDKEMGAGTSHTATFLRSIGPEPWYAAYVQPSRRPKDGRYGENPNRLQHFYQFQVVLKPAPLNIQELYLNSLIKLGIDVMQHDIRFVEDNWENPTLGASGVGWEVWCDGMEISQFTYFQQVGGLECMPVLGELTYGLERLAMYLQNINNVYELFWGLTLNNQKITYGNVFHQNEVEQSKYNFEYSDSKWLFEQFDATELQVKNIVAVNLVLPAYELLLSIAHIFNLLDARGVISTTQRISYINRIRTLAKVIALQYYESRKALNFPLLITL